MTASSTVRPGVRASVRALADSKIREVANPFMADPEIIRLWFGEPDLPTPAFICEAASRAMAEGKTYYVPSLGVPELRQAIADYQTGLKGRPIARERVVVTASGMSAIQIIVQLLVDPDDTVLTTSPLWPNISEASRLAGAHVALIELTVQDGRWSLDMAKLADAIARRPKVLFINSPCNPTGWMMTAEEQRTTLDLCRKHGVWLVVDEVYERIVFERDRAPSVLSIAEPEDRVIGINSFSKNWSMTGWRLGWLAAPADVTDDLAKLTEFNTASAASFVQWAGITAIRDGEPFVAMQVERLRRGRDLVHQRLAANPRIRISKPEGALYAFFAVDGMTDSLAFARRLAGEHKVGLAPGVAFGPGGEGHLRLCFASEAETLSRALDRLETALAT
ncbi:MAG: aminotransferase class I/II-fold pyridoxal phosphate-dependent enzyme [Alphaproteobacteria bacterium]|nr:aminotransferase class I/II-fold pyridoxal phosphate-dependent enzyme [Alphaproteobacteria bacterium]